MGKYKILKKLGEGSFGTVFLVEDEKDHASYVLKQISLTGMTAQELADCKKEISILSLLNHENIVKYIRSFTTKSTLCIVMEFADGGDLQKEIETARDKKQFFEEDRVLTWFTQVACALQHVHALRILHRDLKTQNIFLMKNGDVKLGDFGISRVLTGTMDKATTLVGTPYYLSPEMVNGQPYNQRTDIWALGVVLYEMLTLQRPFQADSLQMLVLKIIAGDYPPIPTQYSDEMKTLLGHCLQQDPNKRYTIEQVLDYPTVKAKIKALGKKVLHETGEEMKTDDPVPPAEQPGDDEVPPPPEEEPEPAVKQPSVTAPPETKPVEVKPPPPPVEERPKPAPPANPPVKATPAPAPTPTPAPAPQPEAKVEEPPKPEPVKRPEVKKTPSLPVGSNPYAGPSAQPVSRFGANNPATGPRTSGSAVVRPTAQTDAAKSTSPSPVRTARNPAAPNRPNPIADKIAANPPAANPPAAAEDNKANATKPVTQRGSSVQRLAANFGTPASNSAPSNVAPIKIPEQAAAAPEESEAKSEGSDMKRLSSGGAAPLSAPADDGKRAPAYKKRFSGVGTVPKDKKLPTAPMDGAPASSTTPTSTPAPSNNPRASGTAVAGNRKPLRGQIEVNTSAPTNVPSATSPPSGGKNGVPQTPREIEEDKGNEEEDNVKTEAQKEKLRRERVSGRVAEVANENYVSKSDQVKILRKHLLDRLGKEKLDRLLAVLESKDDDRTKTERIQDLTEGKKEILAMIHAYIYYSKP